MHHARGARAARDSRHLFSRAASQLPIQSALLYGFTALLSRVSISIYTRYWYYGTVYVCVLRSVERKTD